MHMTKKEIKNNAWTRYAMINTIHIQVRRKQIKMIKTVRKNQQELEVREKWDEEVDTEGNKKKAAWLITCRDRGNLLGVHDNLPIISFEQTKKTQRQSRKIHSFLRLQIIRVLRKNRSQDFSFEESERGNFFMWEWPGGGTCEWQKLTSGHSSVKPATAIYIKLLSHTYIRFHIIPLDPQSCDLRVHENQWFMNSIVSPSHLT